MSTASPDAPGARPPVSVPLPGPLVRARFVERPNRFVVRARLPRDLPDGPDGEPGSHPDAGAVVDTHLADPGRLRELLLPDVPVWLRPADDPARKTRWSTVLVEHPEGGGLVSVDTTLPNRLVGTALDAGALDELTGWRLAAREWSHGRSRFDFLLEAREPAAEGHPDALDATQRRPNAADPGDSGDPTIELDLPAPDEPPTPATSVGDRAGPDRLVLEVKSVTLVEDGVALFPDAVTARGARHVRELAEIARRDGWEAAVLFVLQRPDADRIVAARSIDPDFAEALAEARDAGVRILGRRCVVEKDRVVLGEAVEAGPG